MIGILRDLLKKYQPKNPPTLQWFSILPGVKPVRPTANGYTALYNPHCSPLNMKDYWPVHHYTVSKALDLHPSLIWYSLFSSSSLPADKQKWWGTYCWLAPHMIKCLHLFFPSVSSSSPTVFSFAAVGSELSRPSCSYMDNNRLTPNRDVRDPQKTSSQPPGSWNYSEKSALGLIMDLHGTTAQTRGI